MCRRKNANPSEKSKNAILYVPPLAFSSGRCKWHRLYVPMPFPYHPICQIFSKMLFHMCDMKCHLYVRKYFFGCSIPTTKHVKMICFRMQIPHHATRENDYFWCRIPTTKHAEIFLDAESPPRNTRNDFNAEPPPRNTRK